MSLRKLGKRFVALAVGAVALALAGPAAAQPFPLNGNWTFQGRLTDAGSPANGLYDIQLQIFNAPAGGGLIGASFHNNVQVTAGLFTIPDANAGFLGNFQGDRRWVEIQVRPGASVGAFTILTPRQELTASPYAIYASRAGFSNTVLNHTLDAAYDSGGAGAGRAINADSGEVLVNGASGMRVETVLTVGDADTNGVIDLIVAGARGLEFREHGSQGGAVEGYEENGASRTYYLEPDVTGEGGFLQILRNDGSGGFTVDGNAGGAAGDPVVTIVGDTRSMTFSPGAATDNGSVVLPIDSIASPEILDEAGVSASNRLGPGYAAGILTITEQSSITVPADGFLYIVATAEVVYSHVNGTNTTFTAGLNVDDSTLLPTNQDFATTYPGALPSATYISTVTVSGVFTVSAGSHTAFFLGREDSGNVSFSNDVQLSVLFVPTAYGTVDPRGGGDGDDEEHRMQDRRSITEDDILEARARSQQLNSQRMAREIADLRAQLAEIRKLLAAGNTLPEGR